MLWFIAPCNFVHRMDILITFCTVFHSFWQWTVVFNHDVETWNVFLRLWRSFSSHISNLFEKICQTFVERIPVLVHLCFVKESYNMDCMYLLDEINQICHGWIDHQTIAFIVQKENTAKKKNLQKMKRDLHIGCTFSKVQQGLGD